jgi:signal transduction histidine kinase
MKKKSPYFKPSLFLSVQTTVLEMLARGDCFADTLQVLVQGIESMSGMRCSILVLDEEGTHFSYGAAPSLPADYNQAIESVSIGPQAGSCGTAAYTKKEVIVTDVFNDILWENYHDLARKGGFRACWSMPIFLDGAEVLGTFAVYYDEIRGPSQFEKRLLTEVNHLAAIVLANMRMQKRLQAANLKLEQALNLRDEFIYIASHELKTPLAALTLQAGLLEKIFQKETPPSFNPAASKKTLFRCLDLLKYDLARFSGMIDNLLDTTKLSEGKLKLTTGWVDINKIISEVVDRHRNDFTENRIEIKLTLEPSLLGHFDKDRIDQVIENILTNAIKYGGGNPILICTQKKDSEIQILIQDHGVGISPGDQIKIFNRFERIDQNARIGGLGLGLYIVDQIIDLHKGRITVSSKLGQGSTFLISLPVAA